MKSMAKCRRTEDISQQGAKEVQSHPSDTKSDICLL